jgi:nucleoid-associated protein YgaU
MGLFDFAKKVGAKIFGASEAQAAPAEELKKEAAKHGLDTSGVNVDVQGDKVVLTGNAMSMEEAEKIILAMGNTMGVAQIESKLAVNDAVPASKMVTVKKGDTLWKIAEESYGKGKGGQYDKIFQANRPMLSHPDKIYPGQVLRIPPL